MYYLFLYQTVVADMYGVEKAWYNAGRFASSADARAAAEAMNMSEDCYRVVFTGVLS